MYLGFTQCYEQDGTYLECVTEGFQNVVLVPGCNTELFSPLSSEFFQTFPFHFLIADRHHHSVAAILQLC